MFSKTTTVAGLICLLSAFGVMAQEEKMSMDDMIATLQGIGEPCDPPPTEAMIRELLQHEENPKKETKCFERCLLDMLDMFKPDSNVLDEAKMVEMSSVMYSGKEDDIKALVEVCNAKQGGVDDKCEASHQISMCLFHEAQQRNFDIPMFH